MQKTFKVLDLKTLHLSTGITSQPNICEMLLFMILLSELNSSRKSNSIKLISVKTNKSNKTQTIKLSLSVSVFLYLTFPISDDKILKSLVQKSDKSAKEMFPVWVKFGIQNHKKSL